MEERGRVTSERPPETLAPLGREAGANERLVFLPQLVALLVVHCETQAARGTERIAGQNGQLRELRLRPCPQRSGRVVAYGLGEHRVRRSATPQGKAPVAPTRASGDLACLEQPHA